MKYITFKGEYTYPLAIKIIRELKRKPQSVWDLKNNLGEDYQKIRYVVLRLVNTGILMSKKEQGIKTEKKVYYLSNNEFEIVR